MTAGSALAAASIAETDRPRVSSTKPKLRLPVMLGYGIGQTGGQICRDLPVYILPPYLSLQLGVPAWMMGIVIFGPKLWAIFCDPLVGSFSDRTRTSMGRRRPYLLAAALLCPVALVVLFSVPAFEKDWMRAAYACAAFALLSTASSIFAVPYLSLGAEASDNPRERSRLMAFRLVFVAVGLLACSGGAQALVTAMGEGYHGYQRMAFIMAALSFGTMLTCFFGVRSVRSETPAQKSLSLPMQFRLAAANKNFRLMAGVHFMTMLGSASGATAFVLFITYMTGRPDLFLYMSIVNAIMIVAAQPVWLWISDRLGKRRALMIAMVAVTLIQGSYALVRPGAPIVATLPFFGAASWEDIGLLARHMAIGLTMSGVTLLGLALLTDMLEIHRRETGDSREGAFIGIWSAVEKFGIAAGPLWVGPFLSMMGFSQSTGGAMGAQPPSVLIGLIMAFGFLPALFYAIPIPFIARFPEVTHTEV